MALERPSDADPDPPRTETEADTDPVNVPGRSSYRRTSFVTSGPRPSMMPALSLPDSSYMSRREEEEVRAEEQKLWTDHHLRRQSMSAEDNPAVNGGLLRRHLTNEGSAEAASDATGQFGTPSVPGETTALLADHRPPTVAALSEVNADDAWDQALLAGKIQTTWQREAKVLAKYSQPLVVTFLLQYSLTVASILAVGHLGTTELGAASLASMTANITGYAVYQGLATSLDTLCAQAYGSGRKELVGLQLQRMVYFLWCITVPIAALWLSSDYILRAMVPERELAEMAGTYLKILVLGAPGYAAFESGKRYLQAQGLFGATLYVMLVCAPLNAIMNYVFVWHFGWGYIGAPIAVVVTENLLPIGLLLYVIFVGGRECWPGFSRRAFGNWGPMIRLALPGLLMIEAEWIAFEVLTLAASYYSTAHLAAQSVLSTVLALAYMIPFPISIATSTRVANLIGATLSDAARVSIRVALVTACFVGLLNAVILSCLRAYIPRLFTNDPAVIALVAQVLPIGAAFQLFDSLAASCNGILRGLGRQSIGGWVNLFAYYVVAIPISFGTGFGLHWELVGFWTGPAIALGLVAGIEAWFIYRIKGEEVVEEARKRNSLA